jgi:hypothetical protein
MVFDPIRERMILYGGVADETAEPQVWALSLGGSPAWSPLPTIGETPRPRAYHAAVYDPPRNRMVVIGGNDGDLLDDVWSLSLGESPGWQRLTPSGAGPPAMYGHTAVYDPGRDRILVFGGYDNHAHHSETWALSLSGEPAWLPVFAAGPAPDPRARHSAVYDPFRNRMVIFGGYAWDYPRDRTDSWALELSGDPTWNELSPDCLPPAGRSSHSAVYDPIHDRALIFDGAAGGFTDWGVAERIGVWALNWGSPSRAVVVDARWSGEERPAERRAPELLFLAVLSKGGFHPMRIDLSTLRFADAPVAHRGRRLAPRWIDLDHDGVRDLVLDVSREHPLLAASDRLADLTARTYDGEWIWGWDSVPGAAAHRPEVEPLPVSASLSTSAPVFEIAPNPASVAVHVSFALTFRAQARLEVFDLAGRRVYARELATEAGERKTVSIGEVATLPAGLYLARLSAGGRRTTARFCVIR